MIRLKNLPVTKLAKFTKNRLIARKHKVNIEVTRARRKLHDDKMSFHAREKEQNKLIDMKSDINRVFVFESLNSNTKKEMEILKNGN